MARLGPTGDGAFEARVIRRIAAAPRRVLGIYRLSGRTGRIESIDRRRKRDLAVAHGDTRDAKPGELVEAEVLPGRRLGLRQARITERLGTEGSPSTISLISIHDHDIPHAFSPETLEEAAAAGPAPEDGRGGLAPPCRW